ncbi:hypothetical protein HNP38_000824 [Chryseobacterium defluvii]|uniref:Insertion element IS150 protein InsJ-like helix-turn-helix domain-containing protein n=1 Tax=Chryseobacterium defluvii TaxID=160396 RepID=A0A840KF27_9FLAO|nr:helix-turn-helix domain-containing protein [Chryseobacterium defluvii]MBB4805552.1 hypothetical protein [Chryseobacterium defluvii]
MEADFKNIHIGNYIKKQIEQEEISIDRICNFFKLKEEEILRMYEEKSLDTDVLLRWSKLAEYDFFRIYVTHLLLYDGISHTKNSRKAKQTGDKIVFRKNIYTREIREFLVKLVASKQKTVVEVMQEYNIPRTTIYKWIRKYEITLTNENTQLPKDL